MLRSPSKHGVLYINHYMLASHDGAGLDHKAFEIIGEKSQSFLVHSQLESASYKASGPLALILALI